MDRKIVLAEFIKNDILHNRNAQLADNDDLLSSGSLDSLGILQLVAFIEKTFLIRIPDEDIVFDNFQSISTLAAYINKYR